MRINREEKEKGKTTEQTVESLKRRWARVWEKEKDDGGVAKGVGG